MIVVTVADYGSQILVEPAMREVAQFGGFQSLEKTIFLHFGLIIECSKHIISRLIMVTNVEVL